MDRLDALAAALRTTPAYLLGQDGAAAEPAAPQAAAPEDDPFLQEFWRCAMSLRRDQQEMLLRLMREMGGRR